ncbi:MAG TPA: RIP metalloprotease RseP [Gemmatimonadaceae bacterium]|nr:RIP metalloprotease RseP [Gemmatimonadaceae bacterium]
MLDTLASFAAPLFVFGVVVFVHELGHFLAAKAVGVYAPIFSLGWGRRLVGVKRGETDYRLSIFPLGGFVRMASREDESMAGIEGGGHMDLEEGSRDARLAEDKAAAGALWDEQAMVPFGPRPVPRERWLESQPILARLFIMSAGVIANILLAIVVSSGVYVQYGRSYVPAVVDSVVTGGPAAQAGLLAGDTITRVDGAAIASWSEVLDRVSAVTTGSIAVEVGRSDGRREFTLQPTVADGVNPTTGAPRKVGRIGIAVRNEVVREDVGVGEALVAGLQTTWRMTTSVVDVLTGLFSREVAMSNLGGPIEIARTSVAAAKGGAEMLWSLIAFLSLNIAIVNLVPIPVLDGGQMLVTIAEGIKGQALSMRTREWLARVGVFSVLLLIVLVTFNDIKRLVM